MASRNESAFGAKFLDDVLVWVGENCDPADVFGRAALKEWAEDHGFVAEGSVTPEMCDDEDLHAWARDEGYEK